MGIALFDHQKLAVKQLKNGSILCGRVGSGKSRAALAYYFYRECKGVFEDGSQPLMKSPKDLYIITTAQKRDKLEWDKECLPFLLTVHSETCAYPVKVKIDSWNNVSKYCNVCGAFFIFDEQRVTGSGKWVRSFYQITKKNNWILLSATPGDTWSDYIPVFVANGFYKNKTDFCRQHVIYSPYTNFPKIERYINCQKLVNLRNQILVNMKFIRNIKYENHYLNVGYDKKKYFQIVKDRWNPFLDQPIENASQYCQVLRKVCNISADRIEMVKTIISENPKMIIFYNFDYELEILRSICKNCNIIFAEWNGHKHMPIPKTKTWVYLVQYLSGAEGWECIQTDTILFYSLNYSYKTMTQSAGRIDRLNTPYRTLHYYYIISNAPIERAIQDCLDNKEDFNEKAFQNIEKYTA